MLMPYTGIRNLCEDDIPAVADLHRRVMRPDVPADSDWLGVYRQYFREVFLSPAARAAGLPSLIYQREGRLVGFLGVMPRRMRFNGSPLLAAVCSQFVVDPAERGQVGLQMLKRCFAGQQDLSLTDEAAECTRKIWEWCGGIAALPYSIHWVRPLRPVQAALLLSSDARAPWVRVASPLARGLDALVTRTAGRFRPALPPGSRQELDEQALLECLSTLDSGCAITPSYDAASVKWILDRARGHVEYGAVRAMAVRDESQAISGWFIYHARRNAAGEVLQIAARPRQQRVVLDHLWHDAWDQGVVMLSGRFEPVFAPHLSENQSLLFRRGYWTLVHSGRPEIAQALQRGDAFLTRLEGEWCLRLS